MTINVYDSQANLNRIYHVIKTHYKHRVVIKTRWCDKRKSQYLKMWGISWDDYNAAFAWIKLTNGQTQ